MKLPRPTWFVAALLVALFLLRLPSPADAAESDLPDPLKPWASWATWDEPHRWCPTPFSDPKTHRCFWPSRLAIAATKTGATFEMSATVFHETWVPLPGGHEVWPFDVRANGQPLAVIEHDGAPAVKLFGGTVKIEGAFRWAEVPQRIAIPASIGLLALTLDGNAVEAPAWDAQGSLWLKRDGAADAADKNFLAVKLHAALEDGIPMWLRIDSELTVSGKSREEDLGNIIPEGWKLASIESPIPVAVDEAGRVKVQVRAGKWTLHASAFRADNPKEVRFAQGTKPAVNEMLIAFRARPDLRIVEITGIPSVDVSQTTFPAQWRDLPVYRWETASAFRIEERMRGMGQQKPEGLRITRELWLDEDGRALTFHDRIAGAMQQVWRLDVAEGQDLGSVRSNGQGQLVTLNPATHAPGVEIRTRHLDLEATGRAPRAAQLPASGWRSDADNLSVTLHLPPGWRLFALFGADWVRGDWLTAWTLLDLFVLLIFTVAVFRLSGAATAALAFIALGLSYHEAGAPRYLWLLILVPLALQRVVPAGRGARVVAIGKWIILAAFVFEFVPFIARQVQQGLYPQLERGHDGDDSVFQSSAEFESNSVAPQAPAPAAEMSVRAGSATLAADMAGRVGGVALRKAREYDKDSASNFALGNLSQDTKARIQTGPGVPEWKWRAVSFGWNGPVTDSQKVQPILISLGLERVLTAARVILLLALAGVLLSARKLGSAVFRGSAKSAAVIALLCFTASASAQSQIPDQATLDKLRERLLKPSDAYPHAADIPSVSLSLADRKLVIESEIHAAIRTAVPLPGKLPAWSPLTVLVDGKPEAALRRDDGFLWVVLEPGVHRVRAEGSLANVTEWEWTFLLKPRQVTIEAPGWTFSGVRPDGVPEQQVFFALKQKAATGGASYERQDLQSIAEIDRRLELGLVWQVRTTLKRLSPVGKAIALRVPLLPGENVLSSNVVVRDGFIEVRLGAQEQSFTWESGLAIVPTLKLATRPEDSWVERWQLVVSPVWNLSMSGLAPFFEADAPLPITSNSTIRASGGDLIPTWQPWPGESVELAVSRPEAIAGATMTVARARHEITLGTRQRVSKLDLSILCSLGEDFLVELPADAEITSLSHNDKSIPVRKEGAKLVVPLRPGEQSVSISWKINTPLGVRARGEEVRLPVEVANIQTTINVPDDRWVWWAAGPRRGPAVRFWGILICSLLAAVALGKMSRSPIHTLSWMLLVIGLIQVPLPAAATVVVWLFLLAWRGSERPQTLGAGWFNTLQVFLILITAVSLGILLTAVGEGLLGNPEMFIVGNGSSRTSLRWFQPRGDGVLPTPAVISISIWWYRFFMLAWALWLAMSLIRWLRWGWVNFSAGGIFRRRPKAAAVPPPLPPTAPSTPTP